MYKQQCKVLSTVLIAVILMSLLSLTGCRNSLPGQQEYREVTDCIGRTVAVPKEIERIAALDPFAGQAVIMFGHGEKMKATVGGVKRDLLLQEMCPALKDAAIVKESGTVNAEALLSLQVDLLLLKGDVILNIPEKEKIEKLDIPYLVVDYNSMESQIAAFRVIGEALGEEAEAEKVNAYYRSAIERIDAITKEIPQEKNPRIYHAVNQAVRTDSKGTLGSDWISYTRAENVALGKDLTSDGKNYYTTLEQIFVWDPDLIICNESGVSNYMLTDKKWAGLRAVREGKVYQMPIGVSRWGHEGGLETPLALFWLAKLIYPEEFKDLDLKVEMSFFYGTFFDYTPTSEVIDKILAGEGIRSASTASTESLNN